MAYVCTLNGRRDTNTPVPALTRTKNAHLDVAALAHSPRFACIRLHETRTNGQLRPFSRWRSQWCVVSCSRGLEVGVLDGGAKGEGEIDEEVDATGCEGSVS
jgi:hypothetical protein